jgi:hypothetical protein
VYGSAFRRHGKRLRVLPVLERGEVRTRALRSWERGTSGRWDKKLVYEAYKAVKSNAGASGVDGQSIEQFEADLRNNLYKIWNRMSSGSYFPPPVRAGLHTEEVWRAKDFGCAHCGGPRGSDGCQAGH